MTVAKVALLLLLAVIGSTAAPSAEECQVVTKRLPREDLHKNNGDWVLVWSVSDNEFIQFMLERISTSHLEFQLQPDNTTVKLTVRNIYLHDSSCTVYFINITVPTDNAENSTVHKRMEKYGDVVEQTVTADVIFYETCSDCMLLTYQTRKYRLLFSYKKEGSHRDMEPNKAANNDRKLAECLGFPVEKQYYYDGVADICPKESAPEQP
uniref:Lipocalin/cytosolic fatty-acid binding domain-containing protein n=2 Tax=Poecilia reticulata TaxID=8081 RepID=A0A3P9PS08_POERE